MKTELSDSVFIKTRISNPNKKCKIGEREGERKKRGVFDSGRNRNGVWGWLDRRR